MIESLELARSILDIFGQMNDIRRPRIIPSESTLGQLLEQVFWASLSQYEGRFTTTRIYLTPEAALTKSERILRLAHREPFSADALRRLSPAEHRDGGLLVAEAADGVLYIEGLLGKFPFSTVVHPHWLCVEVRGPGVLRVSTGIEPILEYTRGKVKQLGGMSFDSYSAEFLLMGAGIVTGDHAWEIARAILNIGRAIEQLGTGGALWILPRDRSIPQELAVRGRPVELRTDWWEAFKEEWEMRTAVIRLLNPGCDKGHEFLQPAAQLWDFVRRASTLESIASLAGVDGAIVMNASPDVLAFNVVCNAFTDQTKVLQTTDPLQPLVGGKVVESSTFGGSRHQSAIAFCSALSPAGALVASHDGGLTVFASHEKGLVIGSKVSLIQSDSEVKTQSDAAPSLGPG